VAPNRMFKGIHQSQKNNKKTSYLMSNSEWIYA